MQQIIESKDFKLSGIYCIKNTLNNKLYIGSSHSQETKDKIIKTKTGSKQPKEVSEKRNVSIRKGGKRAGTSQYKGVTWSNEKQRWIAQIRINMKNIRLGQFESEIDAAHNYDFYTHKICKEAYLNFPDEDYTDFVPKRIIDIDQLSI